MPYRLDLHCHSWFSGDGVSSPEALVASAKRRGLHGFAITDHNTCDAYHYMVDHEFARRDGQPVDGFLVIPGVEVSTAEGHLLCIGATLPRLKGVPAVTGEDWGGWPPRRTRAGRHGHRTSPCSDAGLVSSP